jgi:hypothetical protein
VSTRASGSPVGGRSMFMSVTPLAWVKDGWG